MAARLYPAADNWSAGCVLLEALVWAVQGEVGRKLFQAMRRQETSLVPGMHDAGYSLSFHDGHEPLASVSRVLENCKASVRVFDPPEMGITAQVGLAVTTLVLIPNRDARNEAYQFENIFKSLSCFRHGSSQASFDLGTGGGSRPEMPHLPSSWSPVGPLSDPMPMRSSEVR